MTYSPSENKTVSQTYPYEVVVVKHIPSGVPYVAADRVVARHSWGPGDGLSYLQVYHDLNERTAQAVREWQNPARDASLKSADAWKPPPPTSSNPTIDLGDLEKLPWTLYRQGHRSGWVFSDKAPKSLTDQLEKGPVAIGQFSYKFSGPEEKLKLFVSRTPVKEN